MVDCQIRTFDVTDHAVIARFLEVPREKLLPSDLNALAYSDLALKLPADAQGKARVMLPPAILARLIQAAAVKPGDKVLDIASGDGYSTAILAGLAGEVVALKASEPRAAAIKANLAAIGLGSVRVAAGPLTDGAKSEAPFDVILVNGAVEANLDRLFQQLRSGGRLLTIVRKTTAPGYGASHAVKFENQSGRISSCFLFDADAPVLDEFRKEAEFVF
jgi:protein-L-isoaspartate(D-aspartate) O-methyltransferase